MSESIGQRWIARFLTVWAGQSASMIGASMTQFLLVWWVTSTTGSALALSLAALAGFLPRALLGTLGGVAADRWSRQNLMVASDALLATLTLMLAILFSLGLGSLPLVLGILALRSTIQAFQGPATLAATGQLVPPGWLGRAAAMNQAVAGFSGILAAPLGAFALAFVPLTWALGIEVATSTLAVVLVSVYRLPKTHLENRRAAGVWSELKDGLNQVSRTPGLGSLLGVTSLMNVVLVPALTLIPLLVTSQFHGGVGEVAVLEAAGGVGIVAGSLLAVAFSLPRPVVRTVLVLFALASFSITLMGLTSAGWFGVLVAFWLLGSLAWALGNGPVLGVIQRSGPVEYHGRLLSLQTTLTSVSGPLGLATIGALTDVVGIRWIFLATGLVSAVACLAAMGSRALVRLGEGPSAPSSPASNGSPPSRE